MQKRAPIFVTTLIAGAFFMENLDGTIIATALPQMAKSFHTGAVYLNIGMTAYLITLAVFIPISGWVADRFGARSVFASAIGIFTLASVLCGFSHTLTQFTLAAHPARHRRSHDGSRRPPHRPALHAQGSAHPGHRLHHLARSLRAGRRTAHRRLHHHLLQLALDLLSQPAPRHHRLVLTLLWVENTREDHAAQIPFDWMTFLFAGIASTGIVYALEQLGRLGVHWHEPAALLTISVISGVFAILSARRSPHSLIDLESMKIKSYRLSIVGASGFRIAVSVLPFLLPLMFQIGFHLSPFISGMYLLGLFAGDLSMKAFVIQALRRFGFRRILIVNGVITAASVALCATLGLATPPALIVAVLFFHGACRSLEFTCMTTLAYTEITPEKMSRANGFLSAVMQLSLGMGVAVGAVTLRIVAHAHGHLSAFPTIRDFHIAILCVAVLALFPVFDSIGLAHNAGATTSGHQPPLEVNPA